MISIIIKKALATSMNLVVNGELVKVNEIKKITVYLGKYTSDDSSYERVAAKD